MKKYFILTIILSFIFVFPVNSYEPHEWQLWGNVIQVGTMNGSPYVTVKDNSPDHNIWGAELDVNNRNEMYIAAITALTTGDLVLVAIDSQTGKWIDILVAPAQ